MWSVGRSAAAWAGAFGGGGSQATFGARGTGTLLSRATTAAAVIFMFTSLSLTILISRPGGSSVIREGAQQKNQQPAPPAQPPATQPGQPPAQPPAQQGQPAQPPPAPAPPQQQQKSTPAPPATPQKK